MAPRNIIFLLFLTIGVYNVNTDPVGKGMVKKYYSTHENHGCGQYRKCLMDCTSEVIVLTDDLDKANEALGEAAETICRLNEDVDVADETIGNLKKSLIKVEVQVKTLTKEDQRLRRLLDAANASVVKLEKELLYAASEREFLQEELDMTKEELQLYT
ncbi:uncharacterized protein LOC121367207 [Gigantopelta aegis]|uniref:uncharacterized protein LOC121367207 n=1 Tax=Gigantopelta aegis TaxID=1735272 RepID=UPI001B88DE2A|nr:uncharacterized protein LOC121367207 [Gigantopelta aegis]